MINPWRACVRVTVVVLCVYNRSQKKSSNFVPFRSMSIPFRNAVHVPFCVRLRCFAMHVLTSADFMESKYCMEAVSPLFRFFTMIMSCLGYSRTHVTRMFQALRSRRGTKTERLLHVNGNGTDAERNGSER